MEEIMVGLTEKEIYDIINYIETVEFEYSPTKEADELCDKLAKYLPKENP